MSHTRRLSSRFLVLTAVVIVPLCYAFSVGPVMRLAQALNFDLEMMARVYSPLTWCSRQWAPASEWLRGYLEFCGVYHSIVDDMT
jgi:hypothetical protein